MVINKIGSVIARLRAEHGLIQEVLSGLAGIGRSHLASIETGAKHPNLDTLVRIAEAFEMPLSQLIQFCEEQQNDHDNTP